MASSTLTSTRRQSNRALLSVLSKPSGKRPALPHELILKILEYPPCWVLQSRHILPAPAAINSHVGSKVLCCTPPFTARSLKLFGEAIFTFRSHDQGWCSSLDAGSWTWFDVQLENKTSGGDASSSQEDAGGHQEERRMLLQRNRQAERDPMSYTHVLDRSKGILYNLRVGDEIQLLGYARFPGWVNSVEEAAIEIWAVDNLDDEQYPVPEIPIPKPTSNTQHTLGTRLRNLRNFVYKPSRRTHNRHGQ